MTPVEEAADLLRERLSEIKAEQSQLEQALKSLTGERQRRPGRPKVRSGARAKSNGGRRRSNAPRGQRREQLLSFLGQHPGSKPAEIATGLAVSVNQVYGLLRKAQADRLVKKSKGGFAVTARAQSKT